MSRNIIYADGHALAPAWHTDALAYHARLAADPLCAASERAASRRQQPRARQCDSSFVCGNARGRCTMALTPTPNSPRQVRPPLVVRWVALALPGLRGLVVAHGVPEAVR